MLLLALERVGESNSVIRIYIYIYRIPTTFQQRGYIMPKTKMEKRKEALVRMERGPKNPGSDMRVKKYPRSAEKRLEDIAHLKTLIGWS